MIFKHEFLVSDYMMLSCNHDTIRIKITKGLNPLNGSSPKSTYK